MYFELLNAVSYLERQDGLVAIPGLESYYLAARPDRLDALIRIQRVSQQQHPFLLLGFDQAALAPYLGTPPAAADALMHRYWPGPLILMLLANQAVSELLVTPGGQVRVMQPECPLLLSLLSMVPQGVLAVSCASRNGDKPVSNAQDLYNTFGEDVDYVLPGDELVREASSPTVVSVEGDGEIHLLRSGGIVLD